jgi:DNA primase
MNVFQILREQIALDRVVSTNGSAKIRCVAPDHRDNDSSMHIYQDHVHCVACGFHGDVVDLWAAMHGFDRPVEAALDLAQAFGVSLPELSDEGRQSIAERREAEARHQSAAKASHRALERHGGVREWWSTRGFGHELRNRFLLGANKDGTEAVIPFWSGGRVLFLIRRKLQGEPRYIRASSEELPDGYKPLFIPGPLGCELFLVEGFIDALAVAATGRTAVAVGRTKMSVPQRGELQRIMSPESVIHILPDAHESGSEAARTWGREFFPQVKMCTAHYGEGATDIADFFARDGAEGTAEHLDRLMVGAKDMVDLETEVAASLEGTVRDKLAYTTENIVPLLAKISGDSLRDATADIVADSVEGLKKPWLNQGIKEEQGRLKAAYSQELYRRHQEDLQRCQEEYRTKIAEIQPEIDKLFSPGVLTRLRNTAATMHNVYGDREPLELAILVALGAQLAPLPNGRPLGASILLTAPPSRGKNHIIDAAVKPLPPEMIFSFEIASGQSLYYAADENPGFLKHTFAYPNEIEGAEQLWEFLRPMLSKGMAHKIVTAKDPKGNFVSREITVEGPVTIAIPTIRNKTDNQLQTRLLLAELPDYPGRVKEHSVAISEQLLPGAATVDYSRQEFLWQEGLRQLRRSEGRDRSDWRL